MYPLVNHIHNFKLFQIFSMDADHSSCEISDGPAMVFNDGSTCENSDGHHGPSDVDYDADVMASNDEFLHPSQVS